METLLRNPENKIKDISKILDSTSDSLKKGTASLTKILSETRNIQKRNNQSIRSIIIPKEDYKLKKESESLKQSISSQQAPTTSQEPERKEQKPQQPKLPPSNAPGALTFANEPSLFRGNLSVGQDVTSLVSSGDFPAGSFRFTSGFNLDPSQGRRHEGIDIDGNPGTYIALKVDSEVLAASTVVGDSGYGKWISLWATLPSAQVQFLIAHCDQVFITSGKIPAGKSFATLGNTGRSKGPHVHFEYSTSKQLFTSSGDPKQFIKYLHFSKNRSSGLTTTKPNAQISANLNARTSIISSSDIFNNNLNNTSNSISPMILQPQSPQIIQVPVAVATGDDSNTNSLYQSMMYTTLYG